MNDLVTWLRARLDEATDPPHRRNCHVNTPVFGHTMSCNCDMPSRWLAEVAAKRLILDELDSWRHEWSDDAYLACSQATAEAGYGYGALPEGRQGDPCTCGLDDRRDAIRRLLALPHADQPGYDESWRP